MPEGEVGTGAATGAEGGAALGASTTNAAPDGPTTTNAATDAPTDAASAGADTARLPSVEAAPVRQSEARRPKQERAHTAEQRKADRAESPKDIIAKRLDESRLPQRRAEAQACWAAWAAKVPPKAKAVKLYHGEDHPPAKGAAMSANDHDAWVCAKAEKQAAVRAKSVDAAEKAKRTAEARESKRREMHLIRLDQASVREARPVPKGGAKRLRSQLAQLKRLDSNPMMVVETVPSDRFSAKARHGPRSREARQPAAAQKAHWCDEMTETLAGGVPSGGSSASLPAINVRASDAGLATELRHPFVAAARRFIALDNALLGQERVEVVASSVCSPALWSPAPARPAWYFSNSISKERASAAKDASPAKDSAVLSAADIEARFAASTPFDEGSIVAEIRRRRSKFIGRCQREHLLPQKEHLLPNGRPPTVTTPAAAPATEKTRPAAVPAAAQSSGGRPATEKTAVPAALQRPAAETIRPAAEPTVQISGVAAAVQSGRPAEKQHDAADAGPAVALLVDSEHGAIPRPAKAPPPSAVRVAAEAPAAASPAAVDSYEDAFDDDASAAPALSKAPPAAPPARDDAVEAASAAVEAAPTADVSPTAEVKPTADAAPAASPRAAADDDYADDYDAEETAATPQKEASAAETSAAGAAAGAAAGDAPPAAVAQTDRRSVASEDDYAAARDDYDAADDDYADDADADDDDALGADTLCASGDDGGYRDDF